MQFIHFCSPLSKRIIIFKAATIHNFVNILPPNLLMRLFLHFFRLASLKAVQFHALIF